MFRPYSNTDWEVVFKPGPTLRKLYVELTNRCNLSCSMCYRHSWPGRQGEMEEIIFSKLLHELPRFQYLQEIVLGGLGEPLLHSHFWEWLGRLRVAFQGKIVLTTNGLLLTSVEIVELAKLGVERIIVSVDGADKTVQQRVRGTEAGEVSRKLLELGHTIRETPGVTWWWETVWQEKNKEQLPELIKLAAQCHVEKLLVSHLMVTTPAQVGQALFDPELSEKDETILAKARNLALLHRVSLQLPKHRPVTERHCAFVEGQSTVISWDGRVSPCYRFLHGCKEYFYGRTKDVAPFHFGKLTTESLEKIWSKKDYLEFRYRVANSLYPSCPDCELLDGCDVVNRAEGDCDGGRPACGDCLWARGMILCP
ncbi:radical SAM protein [Calderihabitans maritimus]|nr:radical SAM protein [Calderihabitans maritimus]